MHSILYSFCLELLIQELYCDDFPCIKKFRSTIFGPAVRNVPVWLNIFIGHVSVNTVHLSLYKRCTCIDDTVTNVNMAREKADLFFPKKIY